MIAPGQPQIPGFPGERALHGLRHGIPEGPARLLTTLVLRGLPADYHRAAAALVLELDAAATDTKEGNA